MSLNLLNDDNFVDYAIQHYDNPSCRGMEEFMEDLNRIRYLKRLFGRYTTNGELKERLILNHIIIFYNVFGVYPSTRILFNRIDENFHSILKTCIVFLNLLPDGNIPEANIKEIPIDEYVLEQLEAI